MSAVGFPLDAFERAILCHPTSRHYALRREALPDWQPDLLFGNNAITDLLEPDDIAQLSDVTVPSQPTSEAIADQRSSLEQRALDRLQQLAAVVTLQTCYRRYAVQKRYRLYVQHMRKINSEIEAQIAAQDAARPKAKSANILGWTRPNTAKPPTPLPQSVIVRARMTHQHVKYCQMVQRLKGFKLVDFEGFCAVRIQAAWRRCLTQRLLQQIRAEHHDASPEEQMHAFWQTLKAKRGTQLDAQTAARRIQSAWRSHYNRKVFRFMKQLILLKQNADPRKLLHYVNPQEARLMDGSLPIHIRLRFGGRQFPPAMYYKVYVTEGVVDLNAFAPRTYTKLSPAESLPVKSCSTPVTQCQTAIRTAAAQAPGWYQRFENNGWRPVYNGTWTAMEADYNDEVTYETRQQKSNNVAKETYVPYLTKTQRREDLERRRKLKKLNWMREMYNLSRPVETLTTSSTTMAPEALLADGTVSVADAVDERVLEKWAATLDFDLYQMEWLHLATCMSQPEDPIQLLNAVDIDEEIRPETKTEGAKEREDGAIALERVMMPGVVDPDRLLHIFEHHALSLSEIREARARTGISMLSSITPRGMSGIPQASPSGAIDYDLFGLATDQRLTFDFAAFDV